MNAPAQTCPLCSGTGWKPVEQEGVRRVVRCDCRLETAAKRRLEAARIALQYQHCEFENFFTDIYPGNIRYSQNLQFAKLQAQRFADECGVSVEYGLLFMGEPGVGKTHLAVAVLKRLLEKGMDCLFCDYQDLLKQIQASYNPVSQTTEMELLAPVLEANVLLLDDLGSIKPSLWVLDTVGYLINQRYSHKLITLFTTNHLDSPPPAADAEGTRTMVRVKAYRGDTLAERIGERMRSRLYEVCRSVLLEAEDFRQSVKRAQYQR